MALPPGFIDELRTRITLSDVVGRKVVWDRRKSNPAKGDWWAPCPFHQEKTPSFHVDDRKGFFYCFGCQAKGDAIGFMAEIENLPFIEAVERLAAEAGMEMPAREAGRAREARDAHARLYDVMEQAVRLFELALRSGAGAEARDYLAGRGLSDATLKRFEIGFAPDSRTHQTARFREKGVLEQAIAAGLVIRPDDGGSPFDRFRNRVMFPIRDARGRCIAFGGRALSPEARAKYLNSPETPVFSKGRALYNHGPAREAAGRAGTVVVAEGYMDVIALAQAGFAHATAPLGTAVTAEQLQLLWRMADEPVIALDGDEAGLRAANRLVDLALPLLAPGKSLRFCILPEGQDPDDLIRAGGPAAMSRALESARPLIEQLWLRETAAPLDTPERRAAFDQKLRAALTTIADASVRNHYTAEIRTRRAALYRPARPERPQARGPRPAMRGGGGPGRGRGRFAPPEGPSAAARNSALARAGGAALPGARMREGAVLAIACRNPHALGAVEALLEEMVVTAADLAPLRDALLACLGDEEVPGEGDTDRAARFAAALADRLGADPIETLRRVPQALAHPQARAGQPVERVAAAVDEIVRRHAAALAWEAERAEAARELAGAEGEEWTWRLRQAGAQLHALDAPEDPVGDGPEDRPSPLREKLGAVIDKRRR